MKKYLRESWFVFVMAGVLLALIAFMIFHPASSGNTQAIPHFTPQPTASLPLTPTSSPFPLQPTHTPTIFPTSASTTMPRAAGPGDSIEYSHIGEKSGIEIQRLVLAKREVLLPGAPGYIPPLNGNILGLLTIQVTNLGSQPKSYGLFRSELFLDNELVDLWDYGKSGDYALEINGSRASIDAKANFQLEPGGKALLQIWFALKASELPESTFAWTINCDSSLGEDPRFPGILRPICQENSEPIYFQVDLKNLEQTSPDLENLAVMLYPRTWPAAFNPPLAPDDSNLPDCSEDQYAGVATSMAASFDKQNRATGINFASTSGLPDMFMFSAVTSGQTQKITLRRAGQDYEIHLARVYYLTKKAELHSVWVAYGYTDPILWAERQNIVDLYNRGFQNFRGDLTDWSPEEADAAMQIPGQTLSIYLSGWNVHESSVDLFQCPWSWDGIIQADPVACDLALRTEYLAGGGSTNRFIQTETAPLGWYLLNWSINFDGEAGLPVIAPACR